MQTQLDGRACWVALPDPLPTGGPLPVLYWAGGGDDTDILASMDPAHACALIAFSAEDWNRDFSPWPAAALSQKASPFAGEASSTLAWLTGRLLPWAEETFPVRAQADGRGLIGYSLAGLFALWACLSTDSFIACASCSGSLWYDGWLSFLQQAAPVPKSRIYLSLGEKEGKARNPRMAGVDAATRQTQEALSQHPAVAACTLEWNEGGHFHDTAGRIARGIAWLCEQGWA